MDMSGIFFTELELLIWSQCSLGQDPWGGTRIPVPRKEQVDLPRNSFSGLPHLFSWAHSPSLGTAVSFITCWPVASVAQIRQGSGNPFTTLWPS